MCCVYKAVKKEITRKKILLICDSDIVIFFVTL
jgi:hypothetical protein